MKTFHLELQDAPLTESGNIVRRTCSTIVIIFVPYPKIDDLRRFRAPADPRGSRSMVGDATYATNCRHLRSRLVTFSWHPQQQIYKFRETQCRSLSLWSQLKQSYIFSQTREKSPHSTFAYIILRNSLTRAQKNLPHRRLRVTKAISQQCTYDIFKLTGFLLLSTWM